MIRNAYARVVPKISRGWLITVLANFPTSTFILKRRTSFRSLRLPRPCSDTAILTNFSAKDCCLITVECLSLLLQMLQMRVVHQHDRGLRLPLREFGQHRSFHSLS